MGSATILLSRVFSLSRSFHRLLLFLSFQHAERVDDGRSTYLISKRVELVPRIDLLPIACPFLKFVPVYGAF